MNEYIKIKKTINNFKSLLRLYNYSCDIPGNNSAECLNEGIVFLIDTLIQNKKISIDHKIINLYVNNKRYIIYYGLDANYGLYGFKINDEFFLNTEFMLWLIKNVDEFKPFDVI